MNMLVFPRSKEHLGQGPSTLAGPGTAPLSPLLGQNVNCPGPSLVAGVLEPGGCGREVVEPLFLRCVNWGVVLQEVLQQIPWCGLELAYNVHLGCCGQVHQVGLMNQVGFLRSRDLLWKSNIYNAWLSCVHQSPVLLWVLQRSNQ